MRDLTRFKSKKWGVFFHYLERSMNERTCPLSMGRWSDWDECINDFDCNAFAKQLNKFGAGYVILTIMQLGRYMIAPNAAFDKLTGYEPGQACAKTDFIEKMHNALSKYDIDLFLYFTGDGPANDTKAKIGFGGIDHGSWVTDEFVEKWASVAREYSMRYGDKIKGWWLDGAYDFIGYDEKRLQVMYDAMRAGNPNALVGANYFGCLDGRARIYYEVQPPVFDDDYSAGEVVVLGDLPTEGDKRFENKVWQISSPMSVGGDYIIHGGWSSPGSRYSAEFLRNYIDTVNDRGGVVTLGLAIYRDGHIDPEQCEILEKMARLKKNGEI